MTDCGASRESCCTSPEVACGTYYRTYTNVGTGPTEEADPAQVSGFRLDKYLVTVGRFRQFARAWNGGARDLPPAGAGKHAYLNGGRGLSATGGGYEPGWVASDDSHIAPTDANLDCANPTTGTSYATWTTSAGQNESLPINCVNWWEAYAFCIWDGGVLPNESEWEYAAAGESQQRAFPWGTMDPGEDSQYAIYNCLFPSGSTKCTGVANIAPVGIAALGAGRWGQLDMAGEVAQWNLDSYAAYADPCADCAHLMAASSRMIRGGDFLYVHVDIPVPPPLPGTVQPPYAVSFWAPPYRLGISPADRNGALGFRCARAP
ncbi:MAG: formylglycine-generating enzyme family protein [Polyangiaceae bacterium]